MKNMTDKYAIDTTPVPDAPYADTPNTFVQDSSSTDSTFPYSLRDIKFTPYSTKNMKDQKRSKIKLMIRLQ